MYNNFWKQILKKHLYITKKYKDPFLILDFNKYNPLLDLVESNNNFDTKSIIAALSLQSSEKMTGFYNQNKTFSNLNFHLETPYEEISCLLQNKDNEKIVIVVQRYIISSPIISREENINSFENQLYKFSFFSENYKYESEIVSPIVKSSGNVYFTQNSFIIKDSKGNLLCITKKQKNIKIKIKKNNQETFNEQFNIINDISGKTSSLLTCHFENTTHYTSLSKILNENYKGFYEHRVHMYRSHPVQVIMYNLTHLTKNPSKFQEASFFINFNSGNQMFIEVKFEKLISFESGILDNNISFELLNYDQFIPSLWKIKYQRNIYYLKNTDIIFTYMINEFERVYIVYTEIINRNNNKIYGHTWIKYRNLDSEKDIIQQKLKYLFRPLERPLIENYVSEKLPFEAVFPSFSILIIFIITFVLLIVFVILYLMIYFPVLPNPPSPLSV